MVIVKEKTTKQERNTNLTKTVTAVISSKVYDAIQDTIKRNSNMQPFVDAGGDAAMVLAYTIGTVDGIKSYIENGLRQEDRIIFQGVIHKLMDLRNEAMLRLKNSV